MQQEDALQTIGAISVHVDDALIFGLGPVEEEGDLQFLIVLVIYCGIDVLVVILVAEQTI